MYVCTRKSNLRAHFNMNQNVLEKMTLESDSCEDTCTQKNTLRMHKDVKHKANFSTCNKCDYSCTKNQVPVMHKFRKHGGQEAPRNCASSVTSPA